MTRNTLCAKGSQQPCSAYERWCERPGRIAVLPGLVTLDNHLIRSSSAVRNGCGKTTADKCSRTVNREGKPFFSKDRDKVLAEVVAILRADRSEEHTSELQSLMRISYAVLCLKKKQHHTEYHEHH